MLEAVLRDALPADAPRLAALATQVWLQTYATTGIDDVMAAHVLSEFSPPSFGRWIAQAQTQLLVAEVERRLVGYARLSHGAPCPTGGAATVELATLYVQEPFTHAGIGSVLLGHGLARLRERDTCARLWLSVNAGNTRALGFYQRHGFEARGTTHFVLGDERHLNHVLVEAGTSAVAAAPD